jgi:hypothetical protein
MSHTEITWEQIWAEVAWRIEEVAVFDQLRRNGYHYEHCGGDWYRLDIPFIDWGGSLPLADGYTLELNGTLLEIMPRETPTHLIEAQPKEEHPMQEIWDRVENEQLLSKKYARSILSWLHGTRKH